MTDDGQVIEFAGGAAFPLTDDEARERCRNCPPHIRRSIDNFREARGMRRLWSQDGKSAARWTSAGATGEPAEAPPKSPPDAILLAGVVAPGVSVFTVRVATDGERLREKIEPEAYRHFLRSVANGTNVVRLLDGHGGAVLADTAQGSLRLSVDDTVGLVIQAVVPVCSLHRDLLADAFCGECGLSLGLRPVRMELKRVNGERLRVIKETGVDHVAVVRRLLGQGEPAYSGRLFAAFTNDDGAVKAARAKAVVHAVESMKAKKPGGRA